MTQAEKVFKELDDIMHYLNDDWKVGNWNY